MNTNKLFRFEKTENGYTLAEYLQKENKEITELELLADYDNKPVERVGVNSFQYARYLKHIVISPSVREISNFAFFCCSALESVNFNEGLATIGIEAFYGTGLKTVKLPKSVELIRSHAFGSCSGLESAEFAGKLKLAEDVFKGCNKICAENALMSLLRLTDITRAFSDSTFLSCIKDEKDKRCLFRPDVWRLAAENDCFRELGAETLEASLGLCTQIGAIEATAYFLELKNRKFGFTDRTGSDLQL